MRVLLWMMGGDIVPGGHRVQIEQTCKHLQDLGVDAQISFDEVANLSSIDIVHGFGLTPLEIRKCRQLNLCVVLSTIYPGREFVLGQHIPGDKLTEWWRKIRFSLVLTRSVLQGRHVEKCEAFVEKLATSRVAYEMADILLPNSYREAAAIKNELGVTTPFHVVPNAVDHTKFNLEGGVDWSKRDYVLYCGRFEPHKNQLGLIEAMRNSAMLVKLVGHPHPDHKNYYEQCKRRATDNISILPGVSHEDLPPLYRGAKVHILPSWFETTGLVSLEAALCGCNIVTTCRGYARDYFADMAWYCDPAGLNSIRQAVESAYRAPYRVELREHILNHFTWEHTARATLEAYQKGLAQGTKV